MFDCCMDLFLKLLTGSLRGVLAVVVLVPVFSAGGLHTVLKALKPSASRKDQIYAVRYLLQCLQCYPRQLSIPIFRYFLFVCFDLKIPILKQVLP